MDGRMDGGIKSYMYSSICSVPIPPHTHTTHTFTHHTHVHTPHTHTHTTHVHTPHTRTHTTHRLLGPRRKLSLGLIELRERKEAEKRGGGGRGGAKANKRASRPHLLKQPSTELTAAYQQVSQVATEITLSNTNLEPKP